MIQFTKPIIFWDLETTSAEVDTARICQMAFWKLWPDGRNEKKERLVNPTIPIPAEATEVHKITDEMVANEPTFAAMSKGIYAFISDCEAMIGFNSNRFDAPILNLELERAGIQWDYSAVHFIDLCNIFKILQPRDLTAAVKHYLGKEHTDAHSALADVEVLPGILHAMMSNDMVPKSSAEMARFSNYDKEIVDLSGVFGKDDDGDYVFNFGKHKGDKAKNQLGYLRWMQGSTFNADSLRIVNQVLTTNNK